MNTEYEYATSCAFNSDGSLLFVSLNESKRICVYRLSEERNDEGKYYKQVKEISTGHKSNIKSTCVALNDQLIVTCAEDTEVKFWNAEGQVDILDTKQARNNMYTSLTLNTHTHTH
jgi:WD40 repeat protein